ncbi:MAG: hypothetical protein AAB451_00815 [Patescibacteria group bacterium]
MKGRYNGCRMTIYGTILPGAAAIARSAFLTDKLTEREMIDVERLSLHFSQKKGTVEKFKAVPER